MTSLRSQQAYKKLLSLTSEAMQTTDPKDTHLEWLSSQRNRSVVAHHSAVKSGVLSVAATFGELAFIVVREISQTGKYHLSVVDEK